MKTYINSLKGMHDILPKNIFLWNYIERQFKKILNNYCFNEIKIPILEESKLFQRTIGYGTDIIEKEMYSFEDKSGKQITLRPEGTVGCARLIVENNLLHCNKEQKLWYRGPMFRREQPQKGRFRQFHQIGVEVFGFTKPEVELELIMITKRFWEILNIYDNLTLEINTVGSFKDRMLYEKILVSFFQQYKNVLNKNVLLQLSNNPLKILDSKDSTVQKILQESPNLQDYLNDDSIEYFKDVCCLLEKMNIKFVINKHLVRGLDYYNDVVFEWKSNLLGAQKTICAGGRYDELIQKIGGYSTPAAGFAIGIERLILLIQTLNLDNNITNVHNIIDIGIIFIEPCLKIESVKIAEEIREEFPNLRVKSNFFNKSIKKKFQYANKINVYLILLIGLQEFNSKCVVIKNLKTNNQESVPRKNLLKKLHTFF
ncbi:histidine--tRNA ligase [Buchnera aphidicola (Nipponaphis monzeni)]|uniref:Histidine--tRNA ligase n=1 Tax=Buchnera aphidicola (Nipponaphis monzeni) TaxID=2495405 RepID=A0A455TA64_9GAMM|nr:histidine--tRNA ligase [Buchnera aphidicola]BBI01236.1 histidine--tRNA ligase [Buchnera aphidicola (Nipponaphis monzeni)]